MKILFATDGSPGAEGTLATALSLLAPGAISAQVVSVAYVAAALPAVVAGPHAGLVEEYARLTRDIALVRAQALFARHGIAAQALPRVGDPATEILAAANEFGPDVVVMGTHGRSGIGRLILGSVAEQVLRGRAGATLVIHADAPAPASDAPMHCHLCATALVEGGKGFSTYEYSCPQCLAAYHVEGELVTYVTPMLIGNGGQPLVLPIERLHEPVAKP